MIIRFLSFILGIGILIFHCVRGNESGIFLTIIAIGYQLNVFRLEGKLHRRKNYKKYFKVLTTDEWDVIKQRYEDYKAEKNGKD